MSAPVQLGSGRVLVNATNVREDYRLLEVDPKLLSEIVTTGVVIKGGHDGDEAVMCTGSKTFALKYVETTNTQLLVQPEQDLALEDSSQGQENQPANLLSPPGLQTQVQQVRRIASMHPPITIHATTKAHIEVVEIAPRLAPLHCMLAERPYGLGDEEAGVGSSAGMSLGGCSEGLYTLQDLLDSCQASRAEVQAELTAMDAVELEGFMRLVDPSYLGQLLELVILTAQGDGWPLNAIPGDQIAASLAAEGYHPLLVKHCLKVFGSPAGPSSSIEAEETMQVDRDTGTVWALDERKVCIHFAEKILLGADPAQGQDEAAPGPMPASAPWAGTARWPVAQFMHKLQQALPAPFSPSLEKLQGEVLVDGQGHAATIRAFSVRRLPSDPRSRFQVLFEERARWESDELMPFLAGLKVPGQSAAAVLLKYARASQPLPNGPVFYTAR